MHTTYAIDNVRQNSERARAHAELMGRHLAAVRAVCRRASGLRGLFGSCARV
jgi:hypothetical protein